MVSIFYSPVLQLYPGEIVESLLTAFPTEMGQENYHSDSSEKAHPPQNEWKTFTAKQKGPTCFQTQL